MRVRQIAAMLGMAAVVSACGGSSSPKAPPNLPNLPQVQVGIVGTILKYDHVKAHVYCPSEVPQIPGETFSCVGVATQPRVRTFVFQATVHNGTLVSWGLTSST